MKTIELGSPEKAVRSNPGRSVPRVPSVLDTFTSAV
jgi:hypothetical protein